MGKDGGGEVTENWRNGSSEGQKNRGPEKEARSSKAQGSNAGSGVLNSENSK